VAHLLLHGEMTGRNDAKVPYHHPHRAIVGLCWWWGSAGGTAGEGGVEGSV
jgi:hypothetical protein